LLEQVLISIILLLSFSFSLSNTTMSKILYIGIIYALMKANTYMYMIFGGITTTVSSGINMLANKSS
jgi:type II secretory pathway component PulC